MTGILIVVTVLLGIVLLGYAYFLLLLLRYDEPLHADEVHTIPTKDGWHIKLYRRHAKGGRGEPVLFCHSLASNHLNFEIPAGESLVDVLNEAGYDCWTIDTRACRSASPAPGRRKLGATIDDVLLYDLPAALAFIQTTTGFVRVHWVGHSLGGMLLYAYALKFGPDRIASGVTLGSPPGFKHWKLRDRSFLVALDSAAHGIMSFFFRGLIPVFTVLHPKVDLIPVNWDNVHPKVSNAELFYAAEMPYPKIGGEVNRWTTRGIWRMCADTLDVQRGLKELRVPLFAIFGGADPLVPQEEAQVFFRDLPGNDKRMLVLSKHNGHSANYSHIELAFPLNGRDEVFEPILQWVRKHPITKRAGAAASTTRAARKTAARKSTPKKAAAKKVATRSRTAANPRTAQPKKKISVTKAASSKPETAKTKAKRAPARKRSKR